MKKSILLSLILIFSITGSTVIAQGYDNTKTSFAIIGGLNFQNLNGKDIIGNKLENDLLVGFHGGVNAQIPVAPEFYFQPSLLFSSKGAKLNDFSLNLNYVELPLNFVYKALLGNGYFMIGFGPYMAYGVGGKDVKFQKSVDIGDSGDVIYLKPFDAGANLFFGYELPSGLFAQLNTQLGLLNIQPDYKIIDVDAESSVKNTGFGLSLGYRF